MSEVTPAEKALALPGVNSDPKVRLVGKPLERVGNSLDDGLGRVVNPAHVFGQAVQKGAYLRDRRGEQQGIGAGEVAVHRLPGHPDVASHVGDPEVGAGPVYSASRGFENASDRLVVVSRRRPGPSMGAHQRSPSCTLTRGRLMAISTAGSDHA